MIKKIFAYSFSLLAVMFPFLASAHEVYVLTPEQVKTDKQVPLNLLGVFSNPTDVRTILLITVGIIVGICIVFVLQRKTIGEKLAQFFERFKMVGPIAIRLAIATSLIFSAQSGSFLGPEINIQHLPAIAIIKVINYIAAFLILIGLFSEVGAFLMLCVFAYVSFYYGIYLLTYSNYVGELLAILFFGLQYFSIDSLFRTKQFLKKYEKYESLIVRVFFGFALLYTAITVKVLHPFLTYSVVVQYHLTQFHWLFPHDPLLVTFGAALSEIAIALFIILGFELRVTLGIFLFYLTLSLFYFGEVVWPHYILYGIAIYLLVSPNRYSLDAFLKKLRIKN